MLKKPLVDERIERLTSYIEDSMKSIEDEIREGKRANDRIYILLSDLAVDMPDFMPALGKAEKAVVITESSGYGSEDERDEEMPAWVIHSEDLNSLQEKYIRSLLDLPLGMRENFEENEHGSVFEFTAETGSPVSGYMLVDVYMSHKEELDNIAHRIRNYGRKLRRG